MHTIEVVARGYNGGSDDTDDRVLWVQGESVTGLRDLLSSVNAPFEHLGLVDAPVASEDIDFVLPADTPRLIAKLFSFVVADSHAALDTAEGFMNGFEDDETQEGMTAMLEQVRSAQAITDGYGPSPRKHSTKHRP